MKHIWLWELRRRRISTIWWTIGLILLILITVLSYKAIGEQSQQLNDAFADFSTEASSFVGTTDMFSPNGYLNSQLYFITLPILYIILALSLSSSLLSKEESSHTLEVLLARPVSRGRLLLAKALAGLSILAIVGFCVTIATVVCAVAIDMDVSLGGIVLANIGALVFSGAFGAISYALLAASLRTRRFATVAAIVLSFGSYILTSLAGLVEWLEWPIKFLPYHYYDPGSMLEGHVSLGFCLYVAAIYAIAIIASTIGFRRRDIE